MIKLVNHFKYACIKFKIGITMAMPPTRTRKSSWFAMCFWFFESSNNAVLGNIVFYTRLYSHVYPRLLLMLTSSLSNCQAFCYRSMTKMMRKIQHEICTQFNCDCDSQLFAIVTDSWLIPHNYHGPFVGQVLWYSRSRFVARDVLDTNGGSTWFWGVPACAATSSRNLYKISKN